MKKWYIIGNENYIYHHGIKGQKWGIRRYQNYDGTLTKEGRLRYNSVFVSVINLLRSAIFYCCSVVCFVSSASIRLLKIPSDVFISLIIFVYVVSILLSNFTSLSLSNLLISLIETFNASTIFVEISSIFQIRLICVIC